jgi:hypothetical protein
MLRWRLQSQLDVTEDIVVRIHQPPSGIITFPIQLLGDTSHLAKLRRKGDDLVSVCCGSDHPSEKAASK